MQLSQLIQLAMEEAELGSLPAQGLALSGQDEG